MKLHELFVARRRPFVVLVHLAMWTAALLGAYLLRFEFVIPAEYFPGLWLWLAALLVVRSAAYAYYGMFSGMWRYTGARDLTSLFKATTLATAGWVLFLVFIGARPFPRSVVIIEWLGTMILVGGLRFGIRTLWHLATNGVPSADERARRILIVGAGNAGEMLLREIQRVYSHRYHAVGFVDDSEQKVGARIHGVPVLGPVARAADLVRAHDVSEIIIAIPSAHGREMRRIVRECSKSGAAVRTIPSIDHILDGRVTVSQIRSVDIEDLLRREPVTLDLPTIADAIGRRTVMVTGAGGSIGSELCRQICRFDPAGLILAERAENNLFQIHRELSQKFPALPMVPCVVDIRDERRLEEIFATYRPSMVLHAAAHKHVPMMEWNPGEAVLNNVLGTRTLADVSARFSVERFVMISTDKAVNPSSVMGVSKRVAEMYVHALARHARTRFVTVRFGNVLGSAGSVVPIFQQQIASGGPVTITHPEMQRYFMTIPEASQLVLQAGAMGEGGEIFVLDMGEPVRILDLAHDVIRLSGLRPGEDIDITFSGIRPGEKLFEELTLTEEHAEKTRHPKIYVGRTAAPELDALSAELAELEAIAREGDGARLRRKFQEIVPQYSPSAERRAPEPSRPADPGAAVIPLRRPA